MGILLGHHVTDWSKKDYLASVYEGEIYLWHPDTNLPHILTNTGGKVEKCVCWNPSSTHFGMAMDNSRVAVWDFNKNQVSCYFKISIERNFLTLC